MSGRVFGQAMQKRRGGGTRYQRQFGGGKHSKLEVQKTDQELLAERRAQRRRQKQAEGEQLDVDFGYERYDYRSNEPSRRGWVFNILPTVSSLYSI